MNVIAAVVTYNRLALLKECIEGIRNQNFTPSCILVIDNESTDNTSQWLATQPDIITVTQPNKGGSWGFYSAFAQAYKMNADWVWVMDDDTIPEPNALAALVKAVELTRGVAGKFGFFGSKVIWKDGSMHQGNRPVTDPCSNSCLPTAWYQERGLQPLLLSTFVSFFIFREAIAQTGLPLKEMFIWSDDIEYIMRLRKAGFCGAFVPQSVVLHKTPLNSCNDLFCENGGSLWKYRYGIRNGLYIRRHNKSFASYLRNVAKYFLWYPVLIVAKRKDCHWHCVSTVWRAAWEALWFNPKPEKVKS